MDEKSSNAGAGSRPKLRSIEVQPVDLEDGPGILLRDPEGLAEGALLVPRALAPILALFDGSFTLEEMLAELGRPGDAALRAKLEEISGLLEEKLFLEGPRLEQARERLRRDYAGAPRRPARHAGSAYPSDPGELRAQLRSYYKDPAGPAGAPPPETGTPLLGLIAPHIDYRRGGTCYAWSYRELAARGGADLYVILGTCHAGLREPFAATLKSYETPLGPAETDVSVVRALERRSGLDLLSQELAHRNEHSIELQTVFLRESTPPERPFKIVPLLVSYCHELAAAGKRPEDDERVRRFVDALREELSRPGRSVCLVAGADLAHVGPQFGDARLTPEDLRRVEGQDLETLSLVAAGDAAGFFENVARDGDRRRICGYSPIHALLLALDGRAGGRLLRYGQWPDPEGAVTFAGVAFTGAPAGRGKTARPESRRAAD